VEEEEGEEPDQRLDPAHSSERGRERDALRFWTRKTEPLSLRAAKSFSRRARNCGAGEGRVVCGEWRRRRGAESAGCSRGRRTVSRAYLVVAEVRHAGPRRVGGKQPSRASSSDAAAASGAKSSSLSLSRTKSLSLQLRTCVQSCLSCSPVSLQRI